MGDRDIGQAERPGKVIGPADPREKGQHRDPHTDFGNNNGKGHRPFIHRLEAEAKPPQQNRDHRPQDQRYDGGNKCDGQRIAECDHQIVILEQLGIIFQRETVPDDIATAVIEAERHQGQQRHIQEDEGQRHDRQQGPFA